MLLLFMRMFFKKSKENVGHNFWFYVGPNLHHGVFHTVFHLWMHNNYVLQSMKVLTVYKSFMLHMNRVMSFSKSARVKSFVRRKIIRTKRSNEKSERRKKLLQRAISFTTKLATSKSPEVLSWVTEFGLNLITAVIDN